MNKKRIEQIAVKISFVQSYSFKGLPKNVTMSSNHNRHTGPSIRDREGVWGGRALRAIPSPYSPGEAHGLRAARKARSAITALR